MTLANQVTIARILLIPVFVAAVIHYGRTSTESFRWLALGSFFVAAASDGIDGWIARRFNQRTRLGAILDPVADKLLVVAALLVLRHPRGPNLPALPDWLVTTTIARDLILILGFTSIQVVCGRVDVIPKLSGKIATILLMAFVVFFLARPSSAAVIPFATITLFFTVASGFQHSYDGIMQIVRHARRPRMP